jgi:hypothetical protein
MPALSDVMTITEVARRSGVASSALRFYESRGLIASERAGSGHRRYPRAVLRRIRATACGGPGLDLASGLAAPDGFPRKRSVVNHPSSRMYTR